jgi:hypothetical protein
VAEARNVADNLVSAAAAQGFDVDLAAAVGAEGTAAAEAALRDEMARQMAAATAAAAGTPPGGRGGYAAVAPRGSIHRSPAGAPAAAGKHHTPASGLLSGAINAARGRSPAARPSLSGAAAGEHHDGGSVLLPGGGTGSVRVSPSKAVARRISSAHLLEMPARLAASPLPSKATTIADTLQQVFRYFCLFGARDSDGKGAAHSGGMRSNQFAKLVREAGIQGAAGGAASFDPASPSSYGAGGGSGGGRVTPADVDIAFTRAAAASAVAEASAAAAGSPTRGGLAPGAPRSVSVGLGSRIRFEEFLSALNELAVKRYRGAYGGSSGGGVGDSASVAGSVAGSVIVGGAVAADPEAFKLLVSEHLLPLYGRLKTDALFVLDVAEAGAEASAAAFAEAFLREEVLAFFNEHRAALQVRCVCVCVFLSFCLCLCLCVCVCVCVSCTRFRAKSRLARDRWLVREGLPLRLHS